MIVYEERKDHIKEPIRVTCIKCGSKLGIEENDKFALPMFDQREGSYTVPGFKCAVCGTAQKIRRD